MKTKEMLGVGGNSREGERRKSLVNKGCSHQSEWPSSKNLETINAGEGVEKREHSCTVGGNVN